MDPRRERFIHLIYLLILFMQPSFGNRGAWDWLLAIGLAVGFTIWYMSLDVVRGWHPWLLFGVGFSASFLNAGASVFFVYAAFMLGGLFTGRRLWRLLAVAAAFVLVQGLLLFFIYGSWFASMSHGISLGMMAFAGVVSIGEHERAEVNRRLRQANEQIATVSKMAERERIARDMHDVLGHSLSVVVLKSELAGKLIAHDPQRAAAEIKDVEQLARSALKDVRAAISGYRERGFEGELTNARLAFEAADITFTEQVEPVQLRPEAEQVLALMLREAVTNVLRHSEAENCVVRLTAADGQVTLTVSDDGVGGEIIKGQGLKGMRERLEAAGGSLEIDSAGGMKLTAKVPA